MALIGGLLGALVEWFVALLSGLLGSLWGWIVALLHGLFGSFWGWLVAIFGGLLGILWGWVIVGALFAVAAVLNVLGVEDVHGVILRRIDTDDTDGTDPVETVLDISPDAVTDERGRFSPEAFVGVTGTTPAEFVHLFVKSNGGRVKQKTLNTCLPWSKSTVSRLLDSLERDGAIERITIGRENIVCTPEAVPEPEPSAAHN